MTKEEMLGFISKISKFIDNTGSNYANYENCVFVNAKSYISIQIIDKTKKITFCVEEVKK